MAVDIQNIAVSGLACSLPDAGDLAQFWSSQLNGVESTVKTGVSGKIIDLLRDTINSALLDAGLTESPGPGAPIDLVILLDDKSSIPDALISPLNEELKVSTTVSFASMGALPKWLADLQAGQREALVLAAVNIDKVQDLFQPVSNTSVGVVVLQRGGGSLSGQPYAAIKAFSGGEGADLGNLYASAGINPAQIGMLELFSKKQHGGDFDFFSTLAPLFLNESTQQLCPIGFVSALNNQPGAFSWLIGMIKTVLCLHNKIIPSAGFLDIDLSIPPDLPFFLNREARPWINDTAMGPRMAALCCGNTSSGHCVIEEYVAGAGGKTHTEPKPLWIDFEWDSEVILLSAARQEDLLTRVAMLKAYLEQGLPAEGFSLKDAAATMAQSLGEKEYCRLAIVCSSLEELHNYLQIIHTRFLEGNDVFEDLEGVYYSPDGEQNGKIACIFPGQGFPGLLGPYADHLFTLCKVFPAVREVFDSVEKRDNHPLDPDLTGHIFFPPGSLPDDERNRLRQRLAAPRLADFKNMKSPRQRDLSSFGVSVANRVSWILLQELGLKADMIFGQSHGELSALCAAGCLDFSSVIKSHWQIGYDPEELEAGRGRLALVGADDQQLSPLLQENQDVIIAVHVSPSFQILGGDRVQLEKVVSELRKAGIWTQPLPYPAIHTPRFTSLRALFEPFLKDIEVHPFKLPVYSGMICDLYPQTRKRYSRP